MKRLFENRAIFGVLLILAGIVFLMENLLDFSLGNLFWIAAFGAGGLLFLSFYAQNRENWWAFIPGFTLLGLAMTIFLDTFAPAPLRWVTGSVFLGMIGLAFAVIYILRRDFWWAVIPAGVLLTLATVAGVSEIFRVDEIGGGIFFLGLGATFGLVSLLPEGGPKRWALIPAGILSVMGVLILLSVAEWINYFWPLALIAGGALLLLRNLRPSAR